MSETAFPLQWPFGRPRTSEWKRERAAFEATFARARDEIVAEVARLTNQSLRYGGPNVVISTNVPLRRDGLPLAGQKVPSDPGVAVYFKHNKKAMSFACDRWNRVEDNMRAIVKTIEALRGIARWGTGDMLEAAFTGFVALPAPKHWAEILGVPRDARREDVKVAYRRLASQHHPDRPGGSHERMAELNAAQDAALAECFS